MAAILWAHTTRTQKIMKRTFRDVTLPFCLRLSIRYLRVALSSERLQLNPKNQTPGRCSKSPRKQARLFPEQLITARPLK